MDEERLGESVKKLWVYERSCFVLNVGLSGHSIAIDSSISPKGWKLELLSRNQDSALHLANLLDTPPMQDQKILSRNDRRYLLKQYELETALNTIKADLLRLIDLLGQSDRNLRNAQ